MNKEMIYFHSGEVVQLKQDVPNRPKMIVKRPVKSHLTAGSNKLFLGIKCFWFTTTGVYCEQLFNSKDLEKC